MMLLIAVLLLEFAKMSHILLKNTDLSEKEDNYKILK